MHKPVNTNTTANARIQKQKDTHTHSHKYTRTRTHANTHACTQTRAQAAAEQPPLPPSFPGMARGKRSYIISSDGEDDTPLLTVIDYTTQKFWRTSLFPPPEEHDEEEKVPGTLLLPVHVPAPYCLPHAFIPRLTAPVPRRASLPACLLHGPCGRVPLAWALRTRSWTWTAPPSISTRSHSFATCASSSSSCPCPPLTFLCNLCLVPVPCAPLTSGVVFDVV